MYREGRPRKKTFPINLIVDGGVALVVGGGQVGRRKVRQLLEAGAAVELVCPDAVAELSDLALTLNLRQPQRTLPPLRGARQEAPVCEDLNCARLNHVPRRTTQKEDVSHQLDR